MGDLENKEKEAYCCGHKIEHEEHEHHGQEHHAHEEHEHVHEHEHHHEEECCCEHDHEHEHHHEEECCCEHDHEHEHHHEEECCCGHDHEHEHHHDEECGCGCEHDHDHEGHDHDHGHQYKVPGYNLVETHTHEGATVCSFEKDTAMDADEARAAMEEAFREIENWLNAQGAIIGHVKGYIRENGPAVTFSTVGAGVNIQKHEPSGAAVGFASIVFGPDEETMKDKVLEEFSRLK